MDWTNAWVTAGRTMVPGDRRATRGSKAGAELGQAEGPSPSETLAKQIVDGRGSQEPPPGRALRAWSGAQARWG